MTIPSASYPLSTPSPSSSTPETIYDLFLALKAALVAKGVQFGEFLYGPQTVPDAVGATRMTFERDYGADVLGPGTANERSNPKMIRTRWKACVIRIVALSTRKGAARQDHEDLADRLAEQCFVELDRLVKLAKTTWNPQSPNLVARDPNADSNAWQGVLCEFKFAINTPINEVSWAGEPMGEMTMTKDTTVSTLDADGPPAGGELPNASATVRTN